MSEIHEVYQWIEEEYGKPLVVHPQGFGCQHLEVNEGEMDCYWVVIEGDSGRHIRWVIGGVKDISEVEGPASLDCPLFFFELVPNAANSRWREEVREFWSSEF